MLTYVVGLAVTKNTKCKGHGSLDEEVKKGDQPRVSEWVPETLQIILLKDLS